MSARKAPAGGAQGASEAMYQSAVNDPADISGASASEVQAEIRVVLDNAQLAKEHQANKEQAPVYEVRSCIA